MVSDVIPTTSGGKNQKSGKWAKAAKKVKVEGDYNFPTNKPRFASPLYAEISKLEDGSHMTWIHFTERYDVSAQGLSPKHVRVPKDIVAKDIFKLIGPLANKNGYNYVHIDDPKI
jgi:hypothetical protein